jgi:hypothetical protein
MSQPLDSECVALSACIAKLYRRQLLIGRSPTVMGDLKSHVFFKVMHEPESCLQSMWVFPGFSPSFTVNCTNNKIVVADEIRVVTQHSYSQQFFNFVLMQNQQIAFRTVFASHIQDNQLLRINMDEKGMLPRLRSPFALRAAREANVLVWVEEEPELGWQITKLPLFLLAHLLGSRTA